MNRKDALQHLKDIRNDLDQFNHDYVKQVIKDSVQRIGVPIALLHEGAMIDRVRTNRGEVLYNSIDDLGYIKDQDIVENYLDAYGRANLPKQVRFYGAIESPLIRHQRVTAVLETCKDYLGDENLVNIEGQLVTMSRWKVTQTIKVAEIVFAPDAIKANPAIRESFENQMAFLKDAEDRDFLADLTQFYSEEFAREVRTHHDYKISAVFADIIMNDFGVPGIAYPSVPSQYYGENIVLRTDIVDQYLDLHIVGTLRLHKNKKNQLINNHKYVTDFGINKQQFTWADTDPEHVADRATVMERLGYK